MNAPSNNFTSNRQAVNAYSRARPLLGTLVEITATSSSARQTQTAIADAFAAVEKVHALMSYHDIHSDVSRINREGYLREVEVDTHTWRVLRAARLLSEASHGAFDITIAPRLAQLGFLPQHENLRPANTAGSWHDISLTSPNRVRLLGNVQIDLSGIAKGYAVDLATQLLQAAGMASGRVNAGGDMRVFGDEMQNIHVRNPATYTHIIPLLQLSDGAAATSAGYYSEQEHAGRMILPIINPHTGLACDSGRSVTVLAKDCMTADALTKVVYANPRAALPVLKQFKARALVVEHDSASNASHIYDSELAAS